MKLVFTFLSVVFSDDASDTVSMLQSNRLQTNTRAQQDMAQSNRLAAAGPIVNLEDFEQLANESMSARDLAMGFQYYYGGALDLNTWAANVEGWQKIQTWPRYMVDVSSVDTSTTFYGAELTMPVIVPPMAVQKMAHEDGEIGLAKAAASAGVVYTIAESATTSIQDICAAVKGPKMFQIYISTNREQSEILMQRAASCGDDMLALVITVDAPVPGRRETDIRNAFSPPSLGYELVNRRFPELENRTTTAAPAKVQGEDESDDNVKKNFAWRGTRDSGFNWKDLAWIRSVWKKPILLKGLTHPKDAKLAVKYNCGVWVSNHGGRQLDDGPATSEALDGVVRAVRGRVPIVVDSGIRRGGHVVKAVSIGATVAAMGRPVLFALAANGTAGAEKAFNIIRDEIRSNMALTGVTKVRKLRRAYVRLPGEAPPSLKRRR